MDEQFKLGHYRIVWLGSVATIVPRERPHSRRVKKYLRMGGERNAS
jgi:hypothetical protein